LAPDKGRRANRIVMAEGGEQPAGNSRRKADYLERRHQAASSPSIMDMSEDELNEAIAAIFLLLLL
jgi:hypothetical protein